MQGLLQEANMIVSGMEQYYLETSDNEGEAMCALREKIASTIWSHEWVVKRTMFAHGPEMSTVPLEAQFLKTLSTMKQPRRILEIGIFTGYGAATMLKGCENATLVSPEIDSFLKPWVRDGLASMPNPLSRREIEVGLALDTLEKMPSSEAFELVSIDANKSGYMRYVEVLIARGLPAKNAMKMDDSTLKDCENESLVLLEIDPFLKPWFQECLTLMPNILSRHEIEVGPAFDTLEKIPSSEAFDLVSIDANKREYKRYTEVLIAQGLLDKNAMIVADNMLYCGFPSTLSESCCLDVTEPTTRSNTTKDRNLIIAPFPGIVVFCASQSCPWIQSTWQIRTVQQSYEKMGIFEDIDEEHDDTPEEFNEAIYVKTINGKTISTKYYRNMTAAVILQEVERRTLVPRDMIRLVHKGKMKSGEKSMKENNIEAKETIEMSLRLLGGMDVSEQMDTHETEEDREKKRKLDKGKEEK